MGGVTFRAGKAAILGQASDIVFALVARATLIFFGHAGEDETEDGDESRVWVQDCSHDREIDRAMVVGVEPVVQEADGDEDGDCG